MPRTTKPAAAAPATTAPAAKKGAAQAAPGAEPPSYPVPADKWLAKQQKALLDARVELLASALALKAEADALVADAEPGDTQFDDESGEGATTAMDRELDLVLSGQQMAQVKEIDLALAKIQNGTYGICEVTHKQIPKARMEAIPWASVSVEAKTGGLRNRF